MVKMGLTSSETDTLRAQIHAEVGNADVSFGHKMTLNTKCPKCGEPMYLSWRRNNNNQPFWGCKSFIYNKSDPSKYPTYCEYTIAHEVDKKFVKQVKAQQTKTIPPNQNKGGGRTETDEEILKSLESVVRQIHKWAEQRAKTHAAELIAQIKERL